MTAQHTTQSGVHPSQITYASIVTANPCALNAVGGGGGEEGETPTHSQENEQALEDLCKPKRRLWHLKLYERAHCLLRVCFSQNASGSREKRKKNVRRDPRIFLEVKMDQRPTTTVAAAERADLEAKVADFTETFRGILSSLLHASIGFDVRAPTAVENARTAAKEKASEAIDTFLRRELDAIAEAARIAERHQHYEKVVEEILQTEEDYNRDLWILQEIWRPELSRLLSKDDQVKAFGSLGQLVSLSDDLIAALKKEKGKANIEDQRVGHVFLKRAPFFRIYIEYCSKQEEVLGIFSNPKQAKLQDAHQKVLAAHPVLRGMGIAFWHIKPTQRVTKYPLFLRDLVGCTDASHPDFESMCKAQQAIEDVLATINTRTRQRETLLFLIEKVVPRLSWSGGLRPIDLVASRSQLIKQSDLVATITSPEADSVRANHAILLDNVFLVCHVAREQWLVRGFWVPDKLSLGPPQADPCLHSSLLPSLLLLVLITRVLQWSWSLSVRSRRRQSRLRSKTRLKASSGAIASLRPLLSVPKLLPSRCSLLPSFEHFQGLTFPQFKRDSLPEPASPTHETSHSRRHKSRRSSSEAPALETARDQRSNSLSGTAETAKSPVLPDAVPGMAPAFRLLSSVIGAEAAAIRRPESAPSSDQRLRGRHMPSVSEPSSPLVPRRKLSSTSTESRATTAISEVSVIPPVPEPRVVVLDLQPEGASGPRLDSSPGSPASDAGGTDDLLSILPSLAAMPPPPLPARDHSRRRYSESSVK